MKRTVYKLFRKKHLELLDVVKNRNNYFGYTLRQAQDEYNQKYIHSLVQAKLVTVEPSADWGIAKLYPTNAGNSLGRTETEKTKSRNSKIVYLRKLSIPLVSGVALLGVSVLLQMIT